jgi:hypothetical protein
LFFPELNRLSHSGRDARANARERVPADLGLGANYDLDASIQLLFFDGSVPRNDQSRFAKTLRLNPAWVDSHVLDQPCLHRLGTPLAQIKIVIVATKRVGMTFDPENCLRIPLNESA